MPLCRCGCCCCPCRALPHGWYSIVVATLATIGWVFSLIQGSCNYAIVAGPIVQQLDPTFTSQQIPFLQFGLTEFQEPQLEVVDNGVADGTEIQGNYTINWRYGECQAYPEEQLVDTAWSAARAFAFLALVLGGGSTLFVWCSTCFVFSKVTWKWTGYGLLLATICQGLVYIWFSTQLCSWNTCTLSYGAKADMVAAILWGIAGWMILVRYPLPIKRELVAQQSDDDDFEQGVDKAPASDLEMVEPDVVIEQQSGSPSAEQLQYNDKAEIA